MAENIGAAASSDAGGKTEVVFWRLARREGRQALQKAGCAAAPMTIAMGGSLIIVNGLMPTFTAAGGWLRQCSALWIYI